MNWPPTCVIKVKNEHIWSLCALKSPHSIPQGQGIQSAPDLKTPKHTKRMEQSQWQRQAALSGGFDAHGWELEAAKVRAMVCLTTRQSSAH